MRHRLRIAPTSLCLWLLLDGLAIAAAPPAPDVNLAIGGREIRLSEFAGRVVYLDFWASWCTPCRKSLPWMAELQSRHGGRGLQVIAVNLDRDREAAERFLAGLEVGFLVAFDPAGRSAEAFEVQAMPSSYLIDRRGRIRRRHLGFRLGDRDPLEAALDALLAEVP